MELKVHVENKVRIVCGLTANTNVKEIIYAFGGLVLPHLPILNKEAGSKQNHVILPVTVERLYYGDLLLAEGRAYNSH